MKAISLLQPWASLVVMGAKQWETRTWSTFHRGKILIHASQRKDEQARNLCLHEPFKKFVDGIHGFYSLPFGAIIGECKIVETQKTEHARLKLSEQELAFGDYNTGRVAWKLVEPIQYKHPAPCRGALSIWDCPPDVLQAIVKSHMQRT